jgi:hypothetical protein
MGAPPSAGNWLEAIEFAFDSKVFSFGCSAVCRFSGVSINAAFLGATGIGVGAKSTNVNSAGFSSSSGSAG